MPRYSTGITELATIVLVDDDPIILAVFKQVLESLDHMVIPVKSCIEVERLFSDKNRNVDLMLTDYHLPDGKGVSNIQCAKRHNECTKVIVMSSDSGVKKSIGPDICFLHKPFSMEILKQTVQSLLSPLSA